MKIKYITRDERIKELKSFLESEKDYLEVADEDNAKIAAINIKSIEKELLSYGVIA